MQEELSVIIHTYDLLLWSLAHLEKFPRSHRFGLGQRLEGKLYDLLDLLLEAKFSTSKNEILRQASLRVEQARFLFRVGADQKIVAFNSHRHACSLLDQIGREIAGWRRHAGRDH